MDLSKIFKFLLGLVGIGFVIWLIVFLVDQRN